MKKKRMNVKLTLNKHKISKLNSTMVKGAGTLNLGCPMSAYVCGNTDGGHSCVTCNQHTCEVDCDESEGIFCTLTSDTFNMPL